MPKRRARGTGHVYRQKKRNAAGELVEQAVWWIAYRAGGKLHRESTGVTIKTEAEKVLRQRTAAIDRGELVDPVAARTTLTDLRSLVATDYENNGRKSGREVDRAFDRLDEHFGAGFHARAVDDDAVEHYKKARLKEAKPATVNRELAQLRRGLRLAVKRKKLSIPPSFSLLREGRPRAGFLEPDQFAAILKHLNDDLRPLVKFLYWTGWRKSEPLQLEWRQVDRKAGVLRIEDSKNDEARTIPYAALPALKEVIEEQHKKKKAVERKKEIVVPFVFHRGGKVITDFMGAWEVACKKAGLPGRLIHDMRRSAARNMMRAGIPQRVAMSIGGWKTDSVFRRYAIVDERLLAENLVKLADLTK